MIRAAKASKGPLERAIDVRHGKFQRSLAGLTSLGALITGAEIWLEHDRASSGNKLMWWPVWLSPIVSAAGLAGVFSRRAAKTTLPVASALVVANSLQRARRAGGR